MVRLRVGVLTGIDISINEFQFQNGTIKRKERFRIRGYKTKFQFQNGTIKRQKSPVITTTEDISIPKWYD